MFYFVGICLLFLAVSFCEASSRVIGYLPNWLYANYPIQTIDFKKYTHINYAFAIQNTADHLPSFTDDWAIETYLPQIVKGAHDSNTKVLLSIGGWTGSQMFSPMVASVDGRKRFIDWNLNFIRKYSTDGVDIDWEYPGRPAAGCNKYASDDSMNLLILLKELRAALDEAFPQVHKEISMAVYVEPFVVNDKPLENVNEFVPYFDHINIMTYDINGAWADITGPNAPFDARNSNEYSFVKAIKTWKEAGVPAEKITAGLAFYGRSIVSRGDMSLLESQFQASEVGAKKGDSDDAWWVDPSCPSDGAGFSGIWKWKNIRSEGLVNNDLSAGKNWIKYWDDVSKTPWLFNPSTRTYISYDDPHSLEIKVQHTVCEGLGGVMIWDIHQDNGELINLVHKIHNMNTDVCLMKDFNIGINPTEETVPGNTSAQPLETSPVDPIIEDEDDDEDIQYEEATEEVDQKEPKEDEKNEVEHGTESPTPLPSADLPLSKIVDGDACAANGQNKCVDLNNSGDWATCNFNKWVIRPCAPGLVCHEAAGSVYCDVRNSALRMINWSNSESLSKDENNLESQHFVIASAVDSI